MAKKKVELTKEEKNVQQLDRELRELKYESFIPEPSTNIKFNIGDRVRIGNLTKSIITEIVDGGKIYKVHVSHDGQHYGKPTHEEYDRYVPWIDLSTWKSPEQNSKCIKFAEDDTFKLNYCQMDISSILTKVYKFGVDMEPDYQRGNVWGIEDKVKLISSIFMNVDIGKFVFIHLPFKPHSASYEVLDGKQRIIAITEFCENRYKFQGRYFDDLCVKDQNKIERHSVSIATLENESVKLSDKYKYFLRLNVSGKPQDQEHIKRVERLYLEALKNEQK